MKQALVVFFSILIPGPMRAQVEAGAPPLVAPSAPLPQALDKEQIKRLTNTVDRGLIALAGLQKSRWELWAERSRQTGDHLPGGHGLSLPGS